jgi:hypothetical protein
MSNQLASYHAAAERFIAQQQADEDIIGIILTGSLVRGSLDKHSDIDIMMILRPECDFRERGNTWIDGIEIEYFKNSPQQIRRYLQMERNSPHTAHMLTHGRVVYQSSPVIDELITEAKSIWNTPPPPLRPPQIEIAKYSFDDRLKDLQDCYEKQDMMAASMLRFHMVDFSVNIFCKYHQVFRAKIKGLHAQLAEIDPAFAKIVSSMTQGKEAWEKNWPRLKRYMEDLLGGERPKEWVLRSPGEPRS